MFETNRNEFSYISYTSYESTLSFLRFFFGVLTVIELRLKVSGIYLRIIKLK